MKNGKLLWVAIAAAVIAGGCCSSSRCCGPKTDAEGFTYMDGRRVSAEAPGDFYVIRYEYPSAEPHEGTRKALGARWMFTEVRQLGDSVTIVEDGVLKVQKRRL